MFPASEGDCFLITYGEEGSLKRVLVDGGRKATYKILLDHLPASERALELMVISHVDRDHIEGALELLLDEDAGFEFEDIWFNAYRHLNWTPGLEDFGAVQGEKLGRAIERRNLPWNKAFGGAPVRIENGMPIVKELAGGLKLTLLSPDAAKLLALEPVWEAECAAAGLDPREVNPSEDERRAVTSPDEAIETFGSTLEETAAEATREDSAIPNGSSIAFIVDYDGKRVLFAADAHPGLVVQSLKALGEPLPIDFDLVKLSHHGSQANTTPALVGAIRSARFLVSTNGSYFGHPDDSAIARVLVTRMDEPKTLIFNYAQAKTTPWDQSATRKTKYNYGCTFPEPGMPVTIPV